MRGGEIKRENRAEVKKKNEGERMRDEKEKKGGIKKNR